MFLHFISLLSLSSHDSYWMDRYSPENRYIITYEGLTDDLIGAEVTKGLNDFLGRAEGVDPIDRENVECVWKAVVKNTPPEHQKEQIEKLQSAGAQQQPAVKTPPVVNVEQPAVAAAAQQPPAVDYNTLPPPVESANSAYAVPPPNAVYIGQAQPNAEEQLLQQRLIQQPLIQPGASAGVQPPQQQQVLANSYAAAPQTQQYDQTQQVYQTQQQYQQPAVVAPPPNNLRHRRLDPGHHDSQRKGPNVPRPYTAEQLDKIMIMLQEVAQRYSTDVRLNNIMMGYYEKVGKAKVELLASEGGAASGVGLVAPPGGFFR
jgi:hypothetical protein